MEGMEEIANSRSRWREVIQTLCYSGRQKAEETFFFEKINIVTTLSDAAVVK